MEMENFNGFRRGVGLLIRNEGEVFHFCWTFLKENGPETKHFRIICFKNNYMKLFHSPLLSP